MNKNSGPRVTGQKKALHRALIVLKETFEALCSSEETMVRKLARAKLKSADELLGEEYGTSSDRASLLRTVSILYSGLSALQDAESDLVVSIASHEKNAVDAILREWKPRSDAPDLVEIVEHLDFSA